MRRRSTARVASLIEHTRQTTGLAVEQALGDTAYSTRNARAQAEQAGVDLVTKMPSPPMGRYGPGAFQVSADGTTATCPVGIRSSKVKRRGDGYLHEWSPESCGACALKAACTQATRRTLTVPPDFHERRARGRVDSMAR